jgi:ribosomal protein L3 glutamine methyltransferase
MAKIFAHAAVDAIDLSPQALEVARINVARHRLGRRIRLVESDLFSAAGKKRYDLIISNPPYVTTASMRKLPPEYRSEPAMALAGGGNGFDLVDLILTQAADHLTAKGTLVVEIGHHRSRLEQRYPRLPFFWPETSGGDDCVFVLKRLQTFTRGRVPCLGQGHQREETVGDALARGEHDGHLRRGRRFNNVGDACNALSIGYG